ncbi:MAG: stringent starvation protein B [Leptospirales bacterium]|nr:stringent starvation protein B [Leptospirales bacterium]
MERGAPPDQEQLQRLRQFKRATLDVMFQHCDTFYIHCQPHPDLQIGQRGLVQQEKEEGIILVFGPHSVRHLALNDRFLLCELQFSRWESVAIPFECILRMFDKGGRVMVQWAAPAASEEDSATRSAPAAAEDRLIRRSEDSRVIEVDFRRSRKDAPEDA